MVNIPREDPNWTKQKRRDGRILMAVCSGAMLVLVIILPSYFFGYAGQSIPSGILKCWFVLITIPIFGYAALELFILLDKLYLWIENRETHRN